ncbi:oligosaccharide flippase family protein [Acinetobacter johnsonii]|uniref:Oligosaccharide flippase family protein n=1 Tax=Acinetobacter johnsonii TaxID=40214 RepID=A0AA42LHS7_ACIJO|nr:oligosaccharide flippase family protein [Acinetobacter johnsonii]MDH0655840.1 oligosaccharide flippase family protein [Acinetobacter johnsonii]
MERSLRKETMYLYAIQISNFLVPLAAFPYLTNKLGLESFGKFGYAQTIFFLFMFLIDFGFILAGAKSISLNKENSVQVDRIYTNIQVVKFTIFLLLFFSVLFFMYFELFGLKWGEVDTELVFCAIISSFSAVLIPTYLFNGLSINSTLASVTILLKLIFLIPVFLFVNGPSDLILAVSFQIMSGLAVGVIIQGIISKKKYAKFSLKYFDRSVCIQETKSAYDNFIASFFTLGFTYLTPLIIKFTMGDSALGLYTVVDKLINVLRQLYAPLTQAFFAKICIAYGDKNKNQYYLMLKRVSGFFLILGIFALVGNFLFGEKLLPLIFGDLYDVHEFLMIAIITQIIVSLASILVNFVVIPSGMSYILKRIYLFALIIYIPICFLLLNILALKGIFLSMLFIEITILLVLSFFLYKRLLN